MSRIKDFGLTFEDTNEECTFSAGDPVTGTLQFTLSKETKVKSLFVKVKGEANVHWSEGSGDNERTYSDHRRYFKEKQHLVEDGTVLPKGVHCFKFRIQIPHGELPSSFHGMHGKIVYTVEVKLCRSWRFPSGPEAELKFVSKSVPLTAQALCPQAGTVDKFMGVFSKGDVNLSATINRKACCPGETLSVVARVKNASSKSMKPKFSLHEKVLYRANGNTTTSEKCLCKVVGDPITANTEQTVTCQMTIPEYVSCTIHNCDIIEVSYYLKVYLDISFATDPVVVFPLIIVPPRFAAQFQREDFGPFPGGAVGGPSYSDFPAPALPYGPPAPAGPVPYGYPAPFPNPGASVPGGFSYPQQPPPYGAPAAAVPPPPMQVSAPCAPPLSELDPPTYQTLYVLDGRSEPLYVPTDPQKKPF